jgi:hypothetical protein
LWCPLSPLVVFNAIFILASLNNFVIILISGQQRVNVAQLALVFVVSYWWKTCVIVLIILIFLASFLILGPNFRNWTYVHSTDWIAYNRCFKFIRVI